jgi:hypothetical protein
LGYATYAETDHKRKEIEKTDNSELGTSSEVSHVKTLMV